MLSPLTLICLAHGLRCCSDRAWSFVLPLFLASASPGSLAPTAALSLAQSLGVVLLAPPLARCGARSRVRLLVLCENSCVLCGGLAMVRATATTAGELTRSPLFWLSLLLMAVDAAISSVLSLMVEKEYVRTLYGGSPLQLTRANAMVVRVDMGASVGTYTALAVALRRGLLTEGAPLVSLLALWHLLAAGAVLAVLARLRRAAPALLRPERRQEAAEKAAAKAKAAFGAVSLARTVREGSRCWGRLPPAARRGMAGYICLCPCLCDLPCPVTADLLTVPLVPCPCPKPGTSASF